MRGFLYGSLVLGAKAAYVSENLEPGTDHTTYYNDATSLARILPWMKTAEYNGLLDNNGLQKSGAWDTAHSAIDLGNGFADGFAASVGTRNFQGTSSDAAVSFLNAIKNYYQSNVAGGGHTPYNNHIDGNDQTWDHIRNFWYRDGDVFALILDDNAMDMMGGGQNTYNALVAGEEPKVHDIVHHREFSDTSVYYDIVEEEHHMEYLRRFCHRMGGDLWAPTSQAEFDDLIERDGGVCDNHRGIFEDGELWQSEFDQIEIYLNLHREGYLKCPQNGYQLNGNSGDCPQDYGLNDGHILNADNFSVGAGRDMAVDAKETDYHTTDRMFSDDASHDSAHFCGHTTKNINFYSTFEANEANLDSADCPQSAGGGEPFIHENCWVDPVDMRFQKFIRQDSHLINDILTSYESTVTRQKDCVVSTCNKKKVTGTADDARHKSEWNVDHCNQQRHVGICRMRASGCNPWEYACKDDYTDTCNARAVYTRTINPWLDANVQAAAAALFAEATEAQQTGENPSHAYLNSLIDGTDVVFDVAEDDGSLLAAMNAILPISEVIIGAQPFDQCVCECAYDPFAAFNIPFTIESYIDHNASCSDDDNNVQGCVAWWSCNDYCWEGNTGASCAMNGNNWSAGWQWNNATPDDELCTYTCCEAYDDNMNTNANNPDVWEFYKPGDVITVECIPGYHVVGDKNSNSVTFTVGALDSCYQPVACQEHQCESCPVLENGYCRGNPHKNVWDNGDELRCRCNKCYALVDAPNHYPWEDISCTAPDFNTPYGTCHKVQCANPPDLYDAFGEVIAWPDHTHADCGDTIYYTCRDGYVAENGNAPYAVCDDNEPGVFEGDFGQQGFYGNIVGNCVPDNFCYSGPSGQNNAWGAVFIDHHDHTDCHSEWTGEFSADFLAMQSASKWVEGSEAVFECYDDFVAVKKPNFIDITTNAAEDIQCADGHTDEDCRTETTAELFAAHANDNTVRVARSNDKLISRCHNGVWTEPSHKCVCKDAHAREVNKKVWYNSNFFDQDCTSWWWAMHKEWIAVEAQTEAPEPFVSNWGWQLINDDHQIKLTAAMYHQGQSSMNTYCAKAEALETGSNIVLANCDDGNKLQRWSYNADKHLIQSVAEPNFCWQWSDDHTDKVVLANCDVDNAASFSRKRRDAERGNGKGPKIENYGSCADWTTYLPQSYIDAGQTKPCCPAQDNDCHQDAADNGVGLCYCDQQCINFGDCCQDYVQVCAWIQPGYVAPTTTEEPTTTTEEPMTIINIDWVFSEGILTAGNGRVVSYPTEYSNSRKHLYVTEPWSNNFGTALRTHDQDLSAGNNWAYSLTDDDGLIHLTADITNSHPNPSYDYFDFCLEAASTDKNAAVYAAPCDANNELQHFEYKSNNRIHLSAKNSTCLKWAGSAIAVDKCYANVKNKNVFVYEDGELRSVTWSSNGKCVAWNKSSADGVIAQWCMSHNVGYTTISQYFNY